MTKTERIISLFLIGILIGLLVACTVACGRFEVVVPTPTLDPTDHLIVKARSYITITMAKESPVVRQLKNMFTLIPSAYASSSNTVVTVIVANNTQFVVSTGSFNVPATTTIDTLNFGSMTLTTLRDNNLDVCGVGGTDHCTQAILRIYTTGSGEGLWNSAESYGAPFKVTKASVPTVIGLTAVNAVVMDTLAIGPTKNVVHLTDFTASKVYPFTADFFNAGSGTYSTTLTIEYGLQ